MKTYNIEWKLIDGVQDGFVPYASNLLSFRTAICAVGNMNLRSGDEVKVTAMDSSNIILEFTVPEA